MRLVLASASPRRAELLRAAGYAFDTLVVDLDEGVRPGEAPDQYVRRLAMEKSAQAMERVVGGGTNPAKAGSHEIGSHEIGSHEIGSHEIGAHESGAHDGGSHGGMSPAKAGSHNEAQGELLVLGADTAVVVGGAILGKPRDGADGASMLRRLSGRRHEVLTGISLRRGDLEAGRVVSTTVEFAPLDEADIAWYVASGEGRDKAGGYAIQGLASRFIPAIEGSYANVVGLPIAAVRDLIAQIASNDWPGYPT